MLGSFLIKMQAARLATFIKSITCKTLTPSSRPLKVHWKYWSFVALKSDSSSQHPIVSHLWLFPLSSLWHYFLLFPSACSNQANFVITTILPVNQDIIFETKLFFWFEKSVFVLWGIKWWLLSVHTSAVNDFYRWSCIITEKAPTRAFSWLKAHTSAFTFKTLLRHYAERTLTPL